MLLRLPILCCAASRNPHVLIHILRFLDAARLVWAALATHSETLYAKSEERLYTLLPSPFSLLVAPTPRFHR